MNFIKSSMLKANKSVKDFEKLNIVLICASRRRILYPTVETHTIIITKVGQLLMNTNSKSNGLGFEPFYSLKKIN